MFHTDDVLLRYSRHTLLPEIGADGQDKLKNAKVLVVGVGGLGCPAVLYLAAAGVGTIHLVDGDTIDVSNLSRQILYDTVSCGQLKVEFARTRLAALNPDIQIIATPKPFSIDNAESLSGDVDVIIDASDNFHTHDLLNRTAKKLCRPLSMASASQFEGWYSLFDFRSPDSPCYRCLYPEPIKPRSCAESGVLGPLLGILGSLQAQETIKLITGVGESGAGHWLRVDALNFGFTNLTLPRNPTCPYCVEP